MKRAVGYLWILLAALALLFGAGRYGWRIAGFAACDGPKSNFVESVTLQGDRLTVRGGTADSMSAYVGHIQRADGGRLYLGIKHNMFLGFFQRLGGFSITVEGAGGLEEICLKGSGGERLVWIRAEGLIRNAPVEQATQGEDAAGEDAPGAS